MPGFCAPAKPNANSLPSGEKAAVYCWPLGTPAKETIWMVGGFASAEIREIHQIPTHKSKARSIVPALIQIRFGTAEYRSLESPFVTLSGAGCDSESNL